MTDDYEQLAKKITIENRSIETAEAMGYDAGRNMPNERNCHFSLFATPEMTRAWERGKKRGDREREAAECHSGRDGT